MQRDQSLRVGLQRRGWRPRIRSLKSLNGQLSQVGLRGVVCFLCFCGSWCCLASFCVFFLTKRILLMYVCSVAFALATPKRFATLTRRTEAEAWSEKHGGLPGVQSHLSGAQRSGTRSRWAWLLGCCEQKCPKPGVSFEGDDFWGALVFGFTVSLDSVKIPESCPGPINREQGPIRPFTV